MAYITNFLAQTSQFLADVHLFSCASKCSWIFVLSFVPSIIWLIFFWAQDKYREPKNIIIQIFFWGFLTALPVIVIQGLSELYLLPKFQVTHLWWVYGFVGIAFVEEFGKFFVVWTKAVPLKAFNEPQDAMVYMITTALGFAALENFFYALAAYFDLGLFQDSLSTLETRFISATLLHAMASGTAGYFIALALFSPLRFHSIIRKAVIVLGVLFATVLHGAYNHFIIQEEAGALGSMPYASLIIILYGGFILLVLYWHLGRFAPRTAD